MKYEMSIFKNKNKDVPISYSCLGTPFRKITAMLHILSKTLVGLQILLITGSFAMTG